MATASAPRTASLAAATAAGATGCPSSPTVHKSLRLTRACHTTSAAKSRQAAPRRHFRARRKLRPVCCAYLLNIGRSLSTVMTSMPWAAAAAANARATPAFTLARLSDPTIAATRRTLGTSAAAAIVGPATAGWSVRECGWERGTKPRVCCAEPGSRSASTVKMHRHASSRMSKVGSAPSSLCLRMPVHRALSQGVQSRAFSRRSGHLIGATLSLLGTLLHPCLAGG